MKKFDLKTVLLRHKYFLIAAAVLLVGYGMAQFIVHETFKDLRVDMQTQISEQETHLETIAKITARNGADEITDAVIRDCAVNERNEFDALLGRLDAGLSQSELATLERLFGRCGDFFAQRSALMSARLQREVEVYEDAVRQLEIVTDKKTVETYNVSLWKQLSEAETKQSEHFSTLVQLQEEIINTLLSGKRADSEEIKTILQQVQDTQQTMFVANKQASELRSQLMPI